MKQEQEPLTKQYNELLVVSKNTILLKMEILIYKEKNKLQKIIDKHNLDVKL